VPKAPRSCSMEAAIPASYAAAHLPQLLVAVPALELPPPRAVTVGTRGGPGGPGYASGWSSSRLTLLVASAAFASVATPRPWLEPSRRPRLRLAALDPDIPLNLGSEGERANACAHASWAALQAEAENIAAKAGSTGKKLPEEEDRLLQRGAALLVSTSLERLKEFFKPARRFDDPRPLGGAEVNALRMLMDEDSRLITDFLLPGAQMSKAHEVYYEAELYLQRLQMTKKSSENEPVTETQARIEKASSRAIAGEVDAVLENSVLVAREGFTSVARFSYFVQRCRQRLSLERLLRGPETLRVLDYAAELSSDDAVELARVASQEASIAVQQRADALFGDFSYLLKVLGENPQDTEQLGLSQDAALRLTLEAAAFGAALFEAETAASQNYDLHYTSYGSRERRR